LARVIQGRARPRNCRIAGAVNDASERVGASNAGGATVVPFSSNIGQAFRRGEFFTGLFIWDFQTGFSS